MLRYLDLSYANFSFMIPTHLGNLSNLHYLDITASSLRVRDVSWLSSLSSLQYLYMDNVDFTYMSYELFRVVNVMPSLLELHLSSCGLDNLPTSLPFENITSLSVLDLSENSFNSPMPSWLFNMTNLTELNLDFSSLTGSLPVLGRGNLCKLQNLDLSDNDLIGAITQMLGTLSSCSNQSLELLDLSSNYLTGKLPESIGQFNNLYEVDLSSNSLSGPIPASIGNLSNLGSMNLKDNMMNGKIPKSIGQLTKLYTLDLLENNWEGTMTNIHFDNLTSLINFSVSSTTNSLALKVTEDWIPPFKNLFFVKICDCQVGTTFPNWISNQMSLQHVILENVGISEEISHCLYNMPPQIFELDLSHNKIYGYLPKTLNFSFSDSIMVVNLAFNQLKGSIPLWSGVVYLYLRNNFLSGTVPTNIGEEMTDLERLDLSHNHLTGTIPLSTHKIQNLGHLDLSNNYLTGEIQVFWMGMQSLEIIDLSNNNFSGGIPTSICYSPSLLILELSNNHLSADLSSAFQNCTSLQTLIRKQHVVWVFAKRDQQKVKNLPRLSELLLRGNTLTGSIPEELCHLPFLHLLDLAENNLSGSIPTCLGDVDGFKLPQTIFIDLLYALLFIDSESYTRHINLVLKGRTIEYLNEMAVHSTIDLSSNHFSGEIPEKLTELIHLGAQNLSWNRLTGNIPNNIGSLTDLESLDLSHNSLLGPIPPSMASMTFLSYLNLSYNNLSGQIPLANQFQTFNDPSIYEGNPELCGDPLLTHCSSLVPRNEEQEMKHQDDDDMTERLGLYASIVVGYAASFWFVCGSLVLNRSWRHAYFKFVFDIRDKLLVLIAVAKHRLETERN